MVEAFCVKCQDTVNVMDGREKINKRGLMYIQGSCPVCSNKVNRIIGKP